MSRLARVVIPKTAHHITQRGNRRQPVFFRDEDRDLYKRLLREQATRFGVKIWAYCLMDNHVHLVAVPSDKKSLARAIGEAHRRYTTAINAREGWRGYLWQGRFSSVPLDNAHLLAAVRYIETNPVRAGLTSRAEDYLWSSANAHIKKTPDSFIEISPLTNEISDWGSFLASVEPEDRLKALRLHTRTGRPLGEESFLKRCERATSRVLHKLPAGRPQKPTSSRKLSKRKK